MPYQARVPGHDALPTVLCVAARGFKALKQVVKVHYKLGNHSEMLQAYRCGLGAPGHTHNHM